MTLIDELQTQYSRLVQLLEWVRILQCVLLWVLILAIPICLISGNYDIRAIWWTWSALAGFLLMLQIARLMLRRAANSTFARITIIKSSYGRKPSAR